MRFAMPGADWMLALDDDVLRMFRSRAHFDTRSSESVGQPYTPSLASRKVLIHTATVLRPKHASRARVVIDKRVADSERAQMFEHGMHCAGVWHTHPEARPYPSADDIKLADDYAKAAARAGLAGIVFIIVGTAVFPEGLYVGVHDGGTMHSASHLASNELC
ncbi:Mov34/MPN/PAD-1 family protein [Caballeronia grimmiae]|uniref:Mov34/MPN/PAD-1 family protein n=1 Tax=Caballeronia grimmiae TaxID=1071679 RepID=UPI0038BC13B0